MLTLLGGREQAVKKSKGPAVQIKLWASLGKKMDRRFMNRRIIQKRAAGRK